MVDPKLLQLILKVVCKNPEVEYVHYVVGTVNNCLKFKELRDVVCNENLNP